MIFKKLGVNIDHVATVRNARGELFPSPLRAAQVAEKSGADSITIHLREDRRHIRDDDLKNLKRKIKLPVNLEMSPTKEMTKIAIKFKPNFVCIVPEKRKEITTEGGLNVVKKKNTLKKIINLLKKNNIRVSLFIEPKIKNIKISHILGVDCVELHTGKFCNLFNKRKNIYRSYKEIEKSAKYAIMLGLEVHAGHGLTYESAYKISRIKNISEFNIGHFIISESIFFGLKKVVTKFKKIINK
jgi:pyridoxine 5-phosphate synthase